MKFNFTLVIYFVLFIFSNCEDEIVERLNAKRCYSQKKAEVLEECTVNKINRAFQTTNFGKNINDITLDEYQVKGSHNSYAFPLPIQQQMAFYQQYPYQGGVLNIELDIIVDPESVENGVISVEEFQKKDEHYQELMFQNREKQEEYRNKKTQKTLEEVEEEKIQRQQEFEQFKINNKKQKQEIWERQTTYWEFGLQHDGPFNKDAMTFRQQLIELKIWSDEKQQQGNHLPVIVHIDLKHDAANVGLDKDFIQQIDTQIVECLGREKLLIPNDILQYGKHKTLLEAVQADGYPKVVNLLGKFIFIMTGSEKDHVVKQRRDSYNKNPSKRIIFLDIDQRLVKKLSLEKYLEQEKNRIVFNAAADNWTWQKQIIEAKQQKLLTRVYFVNEEYLWDICIELGVNFIATDHLYYTPWSCF